MSISNSNWGDGTSNGPMSVQTARECFQSLKTPEAVTIYTIFPVSTPVSLPGKPAVGVGFTADGRHLLARIRLFLYQWKAL